MGGVRGGGANSNSGLRSERSAWMELINDLKKKRALCLPPFVPPTSYSTELWLLVCPLICEAAHIMTRSVLAGQHLRYT